MRGQEFNIVQRLDQWSMMINNQVSRLLQWSLGEIRWNSVKCEIRAWERLRHAALHAEICWDSRPDEQGGKQQVVFSNFPHHIWDTVLTRMMLVEWLYHIYHIVHAQLDPQFFPSLQEDSVQQKRCHRVGNVGKMHLSAPGHTGLNQHLHQVNNLKLQSCKHFRCHRFRHVS